MTHRTDSNLRELQGFICNNDMSKQYPVLQNKIREMANLIIASILHFEPMVQKLLLYSNILTKK